MFGAPLARPRQHEEYGKEDRRRPVPPGVLDRPPLLETTLRRGDVLFIPAGYVHVARSTAAEASAHLTVATNCADWSAGDLLAGLVLDVLDGGAGGGEDGGSEDGAGAENAAEADGDGAHHHHHPRSLAATWRRPATGDDDIEWLDDFARQVAEGLTGGAVRARFRRAMEKQERTRTEALAAACERSPAAPPWHGGSTTTRLRAGDAGLPMGGISARLPLLPTLAAWMRAIEGADEAGVAVADLAGGPLVCDFTRMAFAALCRQSGVARVVGT